MTSRRQDINTNDGIRCGEVVAQIFVGPDEMNSPTTRIVDAVPGIVSWPVAILSSIEIEPPRRGQGLGSAALKHFILNLEQKDGVKLLLLRVGNFDASEQSGRDYAAWLTAWYETVLHPNSIRWRSIRS